MQIIAQPQDLNAAGGKVCLAIGMFDGVHLGHQQVIGRMIDDARQHEAAAVVATFDRHPGTVVAPARAPQLIHPLEKKLRTIGNLGADAIWLIRFDEAFSRHPAEAFVRQWAAGFRQVVSLCVGGDFVFGHQRGGNVGMLRRLGKELGFAVHGLASVALDGTTVSSTRIREFIRAGDFDNAGQLLGHSYSLCGVVKRGDQLGRKLGFPTANLAIDGLVTPPPGVYAIHAGLGDKSLRGVFNLGVRPTLAQVAPVLHAEAHLFDFAEDLYDRELEITFVSKLRDEQGFPSLDALKAQIARDVAAARELFA